MTRRAALTRTIVLGTALLAALAAESKEPYLPLVSVEERVPEVSQAPARPGADEYVLSAPERQEVRDIIEEFTGPQRAVFTDALVRSGRYLPMVRSILAERGLPQDLAYVALVESHFRVDARSASGAIGLWQFKDVTAREYGLRIDRWVDERLDPEAATRAAARFLEDLYRQFHDWDLAIAAYNGGGGRVGRALDRHGLETFWDLFGINGLRHETCRYVVKFHAAVAIAADPGAYGLALPDPDPPLVYDLVKLDRPLDLPSLARVSGVSLDEVKRLNPALLRGRTPPGPHVLKVPPGTGPLVEDALKAEPEASADGARHVVNRGDTLFSVARRYGTPVKALADANGLRTKSRLRVGSELVIPELGDGAEREVVVKTEAPRKVSKADVAQETPKGVHVVRRGETLWDISKRYGITAAELLRLNRHRSSAGLKPGDRLVVSLRSVAPTL